MSAHAEGAIVAAILGLVIERPLRRIFAQDIARDVFLTIFGIRAPRAYIEGLEDVCRTDHLSYNVVWHISFAWHRAPSVLAVEMECRNRIHNIGSEPFIPKGLWLMGSPRDTPGSRFLRYQMDLAQPDKSVRSLPSLDDKALGKIANTDEGDVAIDREKLLGPNVAIEPGGHTSSVTVGLVYLDLPGLIPLVQNYPALKVEFEFDGGALQDLNLRVQTGRDELILREVEGRLACETQKLALPGAAFLVRLSHRNAPLVAQEAAEATATIA